MFEIYNLEVNVPRTIGIQRDAFVAVNLWIVCWNKARYLTTKIFSSYKLHTTLSYEDRKCWSSNLLIRVNFRRPNIDNALGSKGYRLIGIKRVYVGIRKILEQKFIF